MYLFMPLLCTNKTSLVEFQPNPEKKFQLYPIHEKAVISKPNPTHGWTQPKSNFGSMRQCGLLATVSMATTFKFVAGFNLIRAFTFIHRVSKKR